ncbi:MAG: R3H domain-containing nucleic acid-binding protein, partial [Bacilli bacterium]
LNAYERKIIHDKLSTWKDVSTHSEGEDPNRFLIIEPKE